MVEIFVYFVLKTITRKLKLTKFSLHNNVNTFYVTMLSCTNIIGSSYENLHHQKLPAIRYIIII